MSRRRLVCPECARQIPYSDVKQGTCPHCKTKICIPNSSSRVGLIVGAIAGIWFLVENYRRILAPSINGVVFFLWFAAVFAVIIAVMFVSDLVFVFFFPPVVERAYVEDTFTTLRLDD